MPCNCWEDAKEDLAPGGKDSPKSYTHPYAKKGTVRGTEGERWKGKFVRGGEKRNKRATEKRHEKRLKSFFIVSVRRTDHQLGEES